MLVFLHVLSAAQGTQELVREVMGLIPPAEIEVIKARMGRTGWCRRGRWPLDFGENMVAHEDVLRKVLMARMPTGCSHAPLHLFSSSTKERLHCNQRVCENRCKSCDNLRIWMDWLYFGWFANHI